MFNDIKKLYIGLVEIEDEKCKPWTNYGYTNQGRWSRHNISYHYATDNLSVKFAIFYKHLLVLLP